MGPRNQNDDAVCRVGWHLQRVDRRLEDGLFFWEVSRVGLTVVSWWDEEEAGSEFGDGCGSWLVRCPCAGCG